MKLQEAEDKDARRKHGFKVDVMVEGDIDEIERVIAEGGIEIGEDVVVMDDEGGSVKEESQEEKRRVIHLEEEEEIDVDLLFEESKKAFIAQFQGLPKQCDEVRKEEEQGEID